MGAIVEALASNTSIEVLRVSGLVLDVCKYDDGSMHVCMCMWMALGMVDVYGMNVCMAWIDGYVCCSMYWHVYVLMMREEACMYMHAGCCDVRMVV